MASQAALPWLRLGLLSCLPRYVLGGGAHAAAGGTDSKGQELQCSAQVQHGHMRGIHAIKVCPMLLQASKKPVILTNVVRSA